MASENLLGMELDSLSFAQSSLFGLSNQQTNVEISPISSKEMDHNSSVAIDDDGSTANSSTTDVDFSAGTTRSTTEEIDISPCSKRMKEVRLFSGNTIKLKPKPRKVLDVSEASLSTTESIMDMSDLFSRAKLRSSLKANKERLNEEANDEPKKIIKTSDVWTEKYRPNSFIQLCSAGNDRQYRSILHWLRKWSPIVFGEEQAQEEFRDSWNRTHKKILLVHGPSGIGKTSAIHILAKQMGYSVEELNAANSMDTLPQAGNVEFGRGSNVSVALKLKIMNALTSNSITSNGKPSCLIIDEIDSAINANDIIKVLNELVQADRSTRASKESSESERKHKKKTKEFILNRPIICIANDIYNTSTNRIGGSPMDKLRPLCDIIAFKKPIIIPANSSKKASGNSMRSIKDYLMWINERENLELDYQDIGEIVEVCDGDIRASLNYMQFNGGKKSFSRGYSSNKDSFNKVLIDKQMSWFALVDLLFKRDGSLSKDDNFNILFDSFMNGSCKSVVGSSSSFDKVMKGCFQKYLDVVHFQDDSLKKPSEFSDWLGFYDTFNSGTGGDLSQYSGLVGLKAWSLFSEINSTRNSNSESFVKKGLDYESFELGRQNEATTKRIIDKIPISSKLALGVNPDNFTMQFLPLFSKMLSPELSSRAKARMKDFEKDSIEKVANLVKEFGIRLENQRNLETGQVLLQYYPNWDDLVHFDDPHVPVPISTLAKHYQIKRQQLFPLIAAELERLDMTRKSSKRSHVTLAEEEKKIEQLEEKKKRARMSTSVDFFKDKYDGFHNQLNKVPKQDTELKMSRIWVKYHEGFSNAVRKNITWEDIWIT
ncbi:P-loop containing nucleoside triphosphate hydrolase protein [Scheffersomyces xylosifermentans]|uniref:P-loop containing nucleoside triphosphate hydrolase protein n=1 Tax=Scheffersomyces xylosifermentans TaxID=1304137 RepID=UPI00315D11E8